MLYRQPRANPWTLVTRFGRWIAAMFASHDPQSVDSVSDRTLADLGLHRIESREIRRVMLP